MRGIVAEPGDMTLRSVLADWFEDHGNHSRAVLLRGGKVKFDRKNSWRAAFPEFAEAHTMYQFAVVIDGKTVRPNNSGLFGSDGQYGCYISLSLGMLHSACLPCRPWVHYGKEWVAANPIHSASLAGRYSCVPPSKDVSKSVILSAPLATSNYYNPGANEDNVFRAYLWEFMSQWATGKKSIQRTGREDLVYELEFETREDAQYVLSEAIIRWCRGEVPVPEAVP